MAHTLQRERSARENGVHRVTVALTTRVSADLEKLRDTTGLSKTDLVNRALSLYRFVEELRGDGKQLAIYDPEKGDFQPLHIA